ncbi:MAG: aldose epimerase family protein [Fimbriimonadaceae bacterium]
MPIEPWGVLEDGTPAHLFTLANGRGLKMVVSDYGATITRLEHNGTDVVLGFNDLSDYHSCNAYFGCAIGRYGNRIGGGRFSLNGKSYQLATNNEPGGTPCHLHGGVSGFDRKVWFATLLGEGTPSAILFERVSPHGEEGYPGNLRIRMLYQLTASNALRIEYWATTDADTVLSLTNHTYFNLNGDPSAKGGKGILDHALRINSRYITPTDAGMIPTGELMAVEGTPFDFSRPTTIGSRIDEQNEQLTWAGGYDHNFVLTSSSYAASLSTEVRKVEVWTSEPGIQVYTGNFLDGSYKGKQGGKYEKRSGICLETQHFPDSPNKPMFPTTVLRAGKKFRSATEYRFRMV